LGVGVLFWALARGAPAINAATTSAAAVIAFIVYSIFNKYLKQQQALRPRVPKSTGLGAIQR